MNQWTSDLVTWAPKIDTETGQLPIPTAPGLRLDLDIDVVREHPYDARALFDASKIGWEKRLSAGVRQDAEHSSQISGASK